MLEWQKCFDGIQAIVECGEFHISIVRHSGSYGNKQGLYEMYVREKVYDEDGLRLVPTDHFNMNCDVRGWLTLENVHSILKEIGDYVDNRASVSGN